VLSSRVFIVDSLIPRSVIALSFSSVIFVVLLLLCLHPGLSFLCLVSFDHTVQTDSSSGSSFSVVHDSYLPYH
jgi:hypothetical protein